MTKKLLKCACGRIAEILCRRCSRIVCRKCYHSHGLCKRCAEKLRKGLEDRKHHL